MRSFLALLLAIFCSQGFAGPGFSFPPDIAEKIKNGTIPPLPENIQGKTFLFLDGGNKKNFSILGDAPVRTAILADFSSYIAGYGMYLSWANLGDKAYNNSYDMAQEILRQWNLPDHQVYSTYPAPLVADNINAPESYFNWFNNYSLETRWSCKDALLSIYKRSLSTDLRYTSYVMKGRRNGAEDSLQAPVSSLTSETATFEDRPECYLQRIGPSALSKAREVWKQTKSPTENPGDPEINTRVSSCVKDVCSITEILNQRNPTDMMLMEETWQKSVCWSQDNCRSLYFYDEDQAAAVKSKDNVFVMHLFPYVRWAPRNILTGKPIETPELLKNTHDTRALRAKVLAPGGGDGSLDVGWRTPILSEKFSATVSFLFEPGPNNPDANGFLWLQEKAKNPKWTHYPAVAVQLSNSQVYDPTYIASKILAAFGAGKDFSFIDYKDLTARCGSYWATNERTLAYQIYGQTPVDTSWPASRIPYCYENEDDEKKALLDGRETLRKQKDERPCVLFSSKGASVAQTSRWRLKTDPLTKRPYDVADFIWNGCPDVPKLFWTKGEKVKSSGPGIISVQEGLDTMWVGAHGHSYPVLVPAWRYYKKLYLNNNQVETYLRTRYHRCNPLHIQHACSAFDWIRRMYDINPTFDPTGQLEEMARKMRNSACQDVNALTAQLTQISQTNPAELPDFNRCVDKHAYNSATFPSLWHVDLTKYPAHKLFQ